MTPQKHFALDSVFAPFVPPLVAELELLYAVAAVAVRAQEFYVRLWMQMRPTLALRRRAAARYFAGFRCTRRENAGVVRSSSDVAAKPCAAPFGLGSEMRRSTH